MIKVLNNPYSEKGQEGKSVIITALFIFLLLPFTSIGQLEENGNSPDKDYQKHYKHLMDSLNKSLNEYPLLKQLTSKNDAKAEKAFLQLSEYDTATLKKMLYDNRFALDDNTNISIPYSPERRLVALAELADYYHKNNIPYKPSKELTKQFSRLLNMVNGSAQYAYENKLIAQLTLDDVTQFEYWLSISSDDWHCSGGRILDKFYSGHFYEMVSDPVRLRLYLKKAAVFQRYGIIGTCNKYLWKFEGCKPDVIAQLKVMAKNETDPDVLESINSILDGKFYGSKCTGEFTGLYRDSINVLDSLAHIKNLPDSAMQKACYEISYNDYFLHWIETGNMNNDVRMWFVGELEKYAHQLDSTEFEFEQCKSFATWLAHINEPLLMQVGAAKKVHYAARQEALSLVFLETRYSDLPTLLKINRHTKRKYAYYFLAQHIEDDLAIPEIIYKRKSWKILLRRYKNLSELGFYKSYLQDYGYHDLKDGSVNYARLYDMLEYDVADAFVGGGGSRRRNPAFTAIRYLELLTGTRLGYNWRLEYIRESFIYTEYERACSWMKYLRDKKLVDIPQYHVPSVSN